MNLEIEPLNFFNRGFSALVHVPITSRLHVGSNAFSQTLPDLFADIGFDIDGPNDVTVRQRLGVNLGVRYFLRDSDDYSRGWVASLPVGYETLQLRADSETADYFLLYTAPRIGYLWRPIARAQRLYVLAEAGVIIRLASSGREAVANSSAAIRPVIPLPSIGVGYSF